MTDAAVKGPGMDAVSETVLRAQAKIDRGLIVEPARMLRSAASTALREKNVADAADILHRAVRLGDRDAALDLGHDVFDDPSALRRWQRIHARAVLDGDPDLFDEVADGLQAEGRLLASLDARAQSLSALRRRGGEFTVSVRLAELKRFREAVVGANSPALFDVDTDSCLTVREREVLAFRRSGATLAATAQAVFIAETSVAALLNRCKQKLTVL